MGGACAMLHQLDTPWASNPTFNLNRVLEINVVSCHILDLGFVLRKLNRLTEWGGSEKIAVRSPDWA